ncbi:ChrR family anti-sigma-E factor [Falsihalocynthiibacter sp. SS001]|uniref:ChrR family anti-sigma-E factor n=1 Tax=Falsihalocynthiibacter sp. SS001 TaxID=3349698 RepID=UPI0036D43DF8
MNAISYHIPDHLLASYVSGSLPHPYAVVVATHVSMCLECRAALEAHQAVGGAILESTQEVALSAGLKDSILAKLDAPIIEKPVHGRTGVYPAPVMQELEGQQPRWKPVGMGVRQCVLSASKQGSVRLLYIPGGQAVPDHSHNGLELTLVLQGSFSDEAGQFRVGDVEVADDHVEHTPIADEGPPCICLAATDAPVRFTSFLPRLVQPFIGI